MVVPGCRWLRDHGHNECKEVDVESAVRLRRCSRGRMMRAMAVEFPEVEGHPNRLPFEGCLTLVDVASDKAPSGARGHRVVLTREAAEAALPSLLGMAVDYKAGWDGHDARQKCGIITSAHLEPKEEGQRLLVRGFLFARDYPEFAGSGPKVGTFAAEADGAMGMSYELADAHVAGYACAGVAADAGDVYRSGDSAAGEGGVPGDDVPGEEAHGTGCKEL